MMNTKIAFEQNDIIDRLRMCLYCKYREKLCVRERKQVMGMQLGARLIELAKVFTRVRAGERGIERARDCAI